MGVALTTSMTVIQPATAWPVRAAAVIAAFSGSTSLSSHSSSSLYSLTTSSPRSIE